MKDERIPTPTAPRLGRNIGWTIAGTASYVVSQLLVMVFVARLLGPADVGVFSLASSVVAPVLVLTQMQLRIVLSTDIDYRHPLSDFLTIRAWTTLAMLFVVWLIAAISQYSASAVSVIMLFALAKGFDALSDILYGYHQRREDMRVVAIGQVINGVLSVVLLVVVLWFSRDLVLGMVGFAAGSAASLLGWAVPATVRTRRRDRYDPRGQPVHQWALIRRALPLAVVLFLSALSSSIPRIFIEREMGSYSLGIFAGASYVIVAGANLINSIGNAISPRLAKLYATGDAFGFRRLAGGFAALGAGGALAGALIAALVGGPVLALLYTPDYRAHGPLLAGLFLAASFGYSASFAVGAATAAQRFAAQLPVFVVVCIVGLLSSALLIPSLGLAGAAITTGIMGVVQLLGCGVVVRRAMAEMSDE